MKSIKIGLSRTQDDINISQHWRDILGTNFNTPSHMIRLTAENCQQGKIKSRKGCVTFAREGIAMFDAIVSVFTAKFNYALLRPVTYIRNTIGITDWNSLYPAPQHPAYPATAPCAAGAAVEVLEHRFWKELLILLTALHHALYGSWSYTSLMDCSKMSNEAGHIAASTSDCRG
jgi:hypothetical protein